MHEACLSLWPTDTCEWSIIDIWRWSDLLQRAIYISLALMLVYTFFVLIRFIHYYVFVRRQFRGPGCDCDADRVPPLKQVIADLNRGLGILRAAAFGAPFLALAGTSYGILAVLSGGVSGSRASALSYVWEQLPTPLTSTSAGILVAFLAILFHNVLRAIVERFVAERSPRRFPTGRDLGSFQFAQTLPLRKRISGFPPFAVLGVFALTCAFVIYLGFKPYPEPTGLAVSLQPPALSGASEKQLVITILSKVYDVPTIRVNSREVPWDKLEEVLRKNLQDEAEPQAFVQADGEVFWTYVASVVDTLKRLHCRATLLTASPARKAN